MGADATLSCRSYWSVTGDRGQSGCAQAQHGGWRGTDGVVYGCTENYCGVDCWLQLRGVMV